MRSWSCAITLVALVMGVECQRRVNSNTRPPPTDSNTRLGLISTQLGVAPVPGGQAGNVLNPLAPARGCSCLPINQPCPNEASNFVIRIANRPSAGGECTNPSDKLCCFRGNPIGGIGGGGGGGRPTPVVPNPVQLGACGASNPIPYQQAQPAEAQFAEYPWMAVVLDLADRYLGGGVLISSQWVLTAAHKVHDKQQSNMKVRLGEHDVKRTQDHPQFPHVQIVIDQVIVHPNFNSQSLVNDVALLHLSKPINTQQYPHIGTACMPEQGQLFNGQSCWVTGWGKDAFEQNGKFQNILKEVDVPVVDPFACQARLRSTRLGPGFNLDANSFLCAGGHQGKDACTGDGGAPLVCRNRNGQWTVAGLVAWGIGCAQNEVPGVYVNIPNFSNFIRQYVRA